MKYIKFFCLLNLFPGKKKQYTRLFSKVDKKKEYFTISIYFYILYFIRDFITLYLQSIYLIYSIFYF